ncbi:hypothetical protein AVEN_15400-1 [Araneus ventricosus]|uniref:Uncharacterized protein n=1 Tax=Araneus ventricosus TaxID=182803 RepID=A0A4Y2CRY9_ARAVE|nr:hypothetical protein AVEN_15400-1 [Araneus ventricosus]
MMRKKPELAPPLQTFAPHQQEDVWPPVYYKRATDPIHDGSSVESGFEPGILRIRGRHLTTRTPRPVPNHTRIDRTPPHSPVPDAIAATEPVGWTRDNARIDRWMKGRSHDGCVPKIDTDQQL